MTTRRSVTSNLDTATEESLLFLTKAFRSGVDLSQPQSRALLGAASATVGAWSRYQATASAERQTEVVLANMFARDLGGKPTDYLTDVPEPRALPSGDAER